MHMHLYRWSTCMHMHLYRWSTCMHMHLYRWSTKPVEPREPSAAWGHAEGAGGAPDQARYATHTSASTYASVNLCTCTHAHDPCTRTHTSKNRHAAHTSASCTASLVRRHSTTRSIRSCASTCTHMHACTYMHAPICSYTHAPICTYTHTIMIP